MERRQGGDRRRRRRYRFIDRRSGFDRRVNGIERGFLGCLLYALRDQPGVLARLLVAANILNLADFALTLLVLDSGGREANPLLRPLLAVSPLGAGIFKLVVVLAASLILWGTRYYRKALITSLAMLVVFICLVVYDAVLLVLLG